MIVPLLMDGASSVEVNTDFQKAKGFLEAHLYIKCKTNKHTDKD
jgi:hypothetical protein